VKGGPALLNVRLRTLPFLALGLLTLAAGGCSSLPHAYEPRSPQIPDARTVPLSSGAILTFVQEGSGQSVVLVHGAIADLRIWNAQRGPTLKDFQLTAYSRRYHYPNAWDGNGSDYTDANHDRDLVAMIQELHLGRVHLVGHGTGAQIALEVALAHPELVRTLVLVEPQLNGIAGDRPGFAPLAEERNQVWTGMEIALTTKDSEKAAKLLFDWANANSGAYDALPPPFKGEILDNANVLAFQLAAPPPPMPCGQISGIRLPVLVISGQRSNPFYGMVADAVAACIPGALRETTPGAGHVVQRENPDAFNAELAGFLTTHP
jgi:pimeloyl-ACP methyl ester carboxylesterase